MAQLDPQRRLIVDELRHRFEEIQHGEVPDRPTFVLLRATPGVGKTRIVQELYEALRLEQTAPPFWPPLFSEDVEHSVLKERHLIGPKVGSHFKDHEPSARMGYLWWGIHCENTTSDPLVAAVDDIRFLAPALLEVESRRGRKVLNASGDLTDAASSALGIVSFAGLAAPAAATLLLAIPTPATIVAGAAAALSFTRKYVEWREKKREEEQQRNIHDSANSAYSVEGLAGNLARLSQDLPIVLVVNDAHFASDRVVALLKELNQRRARILVILTSWPVADESRPFPSWWGESGGEEIHLDDLGLETLQSLFDDALPGVIPSVRDSLIERMDQNPLTIRLALSVERRGFRANVLKAQSPDDIKNLQVPRDPIEAFTLFWHGLPKDVRTALALASHLGKDYLDAIIIDAAENLGPLIDGNWDAALTAAGLTGGSESGVVRLNDDDTLHRFIENTFYELADDDARKSGQISEDDTKAIRDQLQRFLRAEHPQLSPRVLQVLRTRLIELANDYDDIDIELALACAIDTAGDLQTNHDYEEALRIATLATQVSQKHQLDETNLGLQALSAKAMALATLWRQPEARSIEQEVLSKRLKVLPENHVQVLEAMSNLATTELELAEYPVALKRLSKVVAEYRKIYPPNHPSLLDATGNLAGALFKLANYDEAAILWQEVFIEYQRILPHDHPTLLQCMGNLANAHHGLEYHDEALFLNEELFSIISGVFPLDHPDVINAMLGLASSYHFVGRHSDALALQDYAVAECLRALQPNHPITLLAMGNLALTYGEVGRHPEAIILFEQVLSEYRQIFPSDHPDTLRTMSNLASSYIGVGDFPGAIRLREEVLTLRRRTLGIDHIDVLRSMGRLANAYHAFGRYPDAMRLYQDALKRCRETLRPDHPYLLSAMHNLAVSYSNLGRHEDAQLLRDEIDRLGS